MNGANHLYKESFCNHPFYLYEEFKEKYPNYDLSKWQNAMKKLLMI